MYTQGWPLTRGTSRDVVLCSRVDPRVYPFCVLFRLLFLQEDERVNQTPENIPTWGSPTVESRIGPKRGFGLTPGEL